MKYYKKLLIPTDGCEPSKAGVLQGLRISKFLGTATEIVIPVEDATFFKEECECKDFEAAEGIVDEIEEAANSISLAVKIITKEGDSKEVMDKMIAADPEVNLVCMGIKGTRDPADALIGSLHQHLLEKARIPIIIQTYFGKKFLKKFNDFKEWVPRIEAHKVTILILMDGSPQSDIAAYEAVQFANQLNVRTKVVALHAVASVKDADGKEKVDPNEHMAIPEKAKNIGLDLGVIVSPEVRVTDDKARELVKRAAELRADIIVMGTHGKTGPMKRFLGNKTEFVLRTVPIPVMIVPPQLRRTMMDIDAEEFVDDIWDELPPK